MADFLGSTSKGSLGGKKQALGFAAADSEPARLEGAIEARAKNERERGRAQVLDFQRKLERNKIEINSKQIEIRRLSQEIFHAESEIHMVESTFKSLDAKGGESKIRVHNFEGQLQEKQQEAVFKKKQIDEKRREETKLQTELADLQRKLAETRRGMAEAEQRIREINLETSHLEGAMHKNAGEAEHVTSDRAYKQKEVDNKKKAMYALEQKRKIDTEEVARLTADNKRLETDIQILQSKFK